ncbi:phage portal protein [Clostridium botulinum]|uniref:phage portal protein n=1 Tax=Clostridium botulinum TaxID=1491 RepID=UPI00035BB055|nr:phage portal protein [Clostridium botulinum]AJD26440.1 phage portal, SPP1 Gp6-like family protein [Clostridium botulinum CDC_297]EPS50152.1 phage protein [Clostridium botulinum A1 str. CFSAN002368]MBY6878398.1 phage portal protein [Clostridium botulinum]MBY6892032.1 phage portal protein [Clostridium botulinum]MBY6894466.1 phage portal protein [Clostridium botulinum]
MEKQARTIRDTLLKLPDNEIAERKRVFTDYYYYKGKSIDLEKAKQNPALYGQNWPVDDNVDYKPTQDIRNKVKPLLKKQARWMFGKKPTLIFKADDLKDKEQCEELRKFIEDVFENNNFWNNTRKAFLEATIKKRVLLRAEANPGEPVTIKYESIENFFYKEKNGRMLKAIFFEEDEMNVYKEEDKDKLYYLHTYYYKVDEYTKALQAWYKKETYKNTDLIEKIEYDTGFSTIPCWLIRNGGELNNTFGESDITDLRDAQNQYNRRNSDFADALRFQMFGSESIIDGNEDDVNRLTIAPNAVHAIKTRDEALAEGKQATIQRQEYNIGSSSALDSYLDRADSDMKETLDMPKISDLNNIPSAKAMVYLYNDLIARCEEKFNDWEKPLLSLMNFIIEVGSVCYPGIFNKAWVQMKYTKIIKQNYPIPNDEDEKKTLAMKEVEADVRSRKSYIKEYSDEEDIEKAFEEMLDEKAMMINAESDQYNKALDNELDNLDDKSNNKGIVGDE